MPRKGWDLLHRTYREKHGKDTSMEEFKRQSEEALRDMSGQKQRQVDMTEEAICQSSLSGKNTIAAINEYALSMANYYIGAVPLEENDYLRIDKEVRKILIKHRIHLQPANTQRLYLPRKELGRGLGNLVHKSERIELQLFKTLERAKDTSLRRAAILAEMKAVNSSTALIETYLSIKYGLTGEVTLEALETAQKTEWKSAEQARENATP